MAEQFITCPKCNERIKLTDAIKHPIEEALRQEFEAQDKRREKEFDEKLANERAQLGKKG